LLAVVTARLDSIFLKIEGSMAPLATRTVLSSVKPSVDRSAPLSERIVIVGAGQAAGVAAASLREQGYAGEIVLVGNEPVGPYQRPPLSKNFLAGQMAAEQLQLKPAKFYAERAIGLKLGARVQAIDRAAKEVRLDNGESVAYTKLLLATGSRPCRLSLPGAELAGVHYLRTLADVEAIRREMGAGKHLVIVGAGYIGLEAAAVAVQAGMQVTVLELADRILGRVAGAVVAEFLRAAHESHGVVIRLGARLTEFAGRSRVQAVVCGGERLPADLVIAGVGIVPNVELAEAAGLACDNGIVVDELTRTADPDIHACGDCTNHPNALLGVRLRLESVQNAIDQARAAASNLCGKPKTYAELPWFWSNQYDLRLQIAGLAGGHDRVLVRGAVASGAFSVMYVKGERLIAAETINAARDHLAFRKAIAAGGAVDAGRLTDPAVAIG
jgi:3-phenylpropionate/trans-cinnamate dioxygenase ferredoxin reductase subunit